MNDNFDDQKYQLNAKVDGDMVNISIGVELLAFAVSNSPEMEGVTVTDPTAFVSELLLYLMNEEEDGSTRLHHAFDAAALDAVESGCKGVEYE